jgi:hypothetical protein
MKNSIRLALFAALLAAAPASAADKNASLPGVPQRQESDGPAPAAMEDNQGNLPEVVIKGGEKSAIGSEKPPLEIQSDPDQPVQPVLEVEEDLLKRQPEGMRNPQAGFFPSLASQNAIVPGRIRLARDPVKVFYPLREIMAVSPSLSQEIGTGWEMVVTDTEGRSLRKLSGKGLPPATVPWNGRSERGEIIGVGKSYSTVIIYRDVRGQARNFVGEPFSFDGIIHQESKGLVISLSVPALFDNKKTGEGEAVSYSGMELLQEASDYIKRYYFTYPVRVECYSKDDATAQSRAQVTAKTLGGLLLLPRGEIPSSGTFADSINERVDIVIANR